MSFSSIKRKDYFTEIFIIEYQDNIRKIGKKQNRSIQRTFL